jgi:anti-anti-sigma factor
MVDERGLKSGLVSTVEDPDDGPASPMLQVFALPPPKLDGHRDAVVLRMVGELCAYSAGEVEPVLRHQVERADSVVIDLADLRFLDAAGLQLLNDLAHGPEGFRLENVDQRIARIFDIAGLGRLVRHEGSRAAS